MTWRIDRYNDEKSNEIIENVKKMKRWWKDDEKMIKKK